MQCHKMNGLRAMAAAGGSTTHVLYSHQLRSAFFMQHAQCEDTQMLHFHCRRNWASRARAVTPPITW
ncbi:hypothetical protein HHUSO_G18249 [Huso huso]|uniref:Uncharacterized protein n=1 Tax=Huso huso TaxID=61971 RepID=A0ABR0Z7B2_HUSHU